MEKKSENHTHDLQTLEWIADWLDNKFTIPGTQYRFGLDALLGVLPGVGDVAGLAVSGYLISLMARRGASPIIMLRMLGNVALDALAGAVPVVGDLFDVGFRANRRNVEMLKKYYAEGKKRPPAGWSLAVLILIFFVVMVLILWGVWKVSAWVFQSLFG